jgi:hypothetical protein
MTKATSEAITLPGGVTAEPGMGINNQKLGMWVLLT